ncbi:hypothetical protein [Actinopolymorpha pittospori]
MENVVLAGGEASGLSGWALRELILVALEALPRRQADEWLREHRQVRAFLQAQSPPTPAP